MTKIEFKGSIWAKNEAYVITVPKAYVKHGQLECGNQYKVTLEDIEKEKEVNTDESKR